jgi:hypothetical protein
MPSRVIDTPDDLAQMVKFLRTLNLPITMNWVQGRDRTGEQNSLQWMWAGEVAYQLGDRTAEEVQDEWRLTHGVPILREDDAEFREVYDRCLKHLPHEVKKTALRKMHISITSIMKVRQMVRYMDAVQRECAEMGLVTTEPDPLLSKYMNRYRAKDKAA